MKGIKGSGTCKTTAQPMAGWSTPAPENTKSRKLLRRSSKTDRWKDPEQNAHNGRLFATKAGRCGQSAEALA